MSNDNPSGDNNCTPGSTTDSSIIKPAQLAMIVAAAAAVGGAVGAAIGSLLGNG